MLIRRDGEPKFHTAFCQEVAQCPKRNSLNTLKQYYQASSLSAKPLPPLTRQHRSNATTHISSIPLGPTPLLLLRPPGEQLLYNVLALPEKCHQSGPPPFRGTAYGCCNFTQELLWGPHQGIRPEISLRIAWLHRQHARLTCWDGSADVDISAL